MANGMITLARTGSGFLSGQILWSSESNGTQANTSTLTASLQVQRSAQNTTTGTFTGTFTVGGTSETISVFTDLPSNTWVTLKTITVTVSHNANGAGSCYLYAKINGPTGTSMADTSVSGSATVTLDSIPRYAYIVSAPDFHDEENPTITYVNPIGNSAASLDACISLDGSQADVAYRSLDKSGTSYTFQLTEAERNVLRSATAEGNSRQVRFYVRTGIGNSTGRSSLARTFTIRNPNPTIAPVITDSNSATVALTGNTNKLVRYFSNAAVTMGAAAVKQATLKSKKVTCGNKSLNADGTITGVESGSFTFSATDSRGNTTVKTVEVPFVEYIKLTCDLANHIPEANGNLLVAVSGNYFNGSFGSAGNTLQVQYRYRPRGGTYSSWITITNSKSGNTYTAQTTLTGLNYKTTYEVEARATDRLATVTSSSKTVKATPVFDWGEHDFRFNVPVDMAGNKMFALADPTEPGEVVTLRFLNALGLGAGGKGTTDLNQETDGGWYSFSSGCANAPFNYGVALVLRRYSDDVVQIAFDTYRSGSGVGELCVRVNNGTWQPWEYVNPPMRPGTEYRTVERHNGKPVYRRLVSFRNSSTIGSSSGVSSTSIPHNISGFGSLVRVSGAVGNYALPYLSSSGGLTVISSVTSASIVLDTYNTTWSSRDWLFDVAYTK